jgi:hypothetical protein
MTRRAGTSGDTLDRDFTPDVHNGRIRTGAPTDADRIAAASRDIS